MAETLTVNTDADPATVVDNLTPEEQDSLQVGEAMEAEHNQLLAGKYKNAEDLEKAYVELQKKLGEKGDETSETTGDTDALDGEETSEETEETTEDSPAVSLINEANEEFYANGNQLSAETIEKFSQMSSQDLVNAYVEIQKNQPQPTQAADLSDSDINVIKNSVGGEAEYGNIVGWAAENLDQTSIDAFDNIVEGGNKAAIQLALNGLRAQYENTNGYEGRMLTGKAPQNSGDVFRSQAEVVAAMTDARYENDPAYRQDLIEKLDRSNIDF
jgi:hypothetical protein